MRRSGILLVTLTFLLPSMTLSAGELAGVTLDDSAKAGDASLVLNGLGLRKKFGIKVYIGGLYLEAKAADAGKLLQADAPRHMVMYFLRGVSKKQLCGGWDDGLEGNTPGAPDAVKKDFQTLCGYMEDVGKGDRLTFTYVPGSGTEVMVRGAAKGTLAGKAFADALLACWLGPKPPSGDFKEGLLGN